jgi:hypothetical protein
MLFGILGSRAASAQPALEVPYYLLEACTYPGSERILSHRREGHAPRPTSASWPRMVKRRTSSDSGNMSERRAW